MNPSLRGHGIAHRLLREAQHVLGRPGLLVMVKAHQTISTKAPIRSSPPTINQTSNYASARFRRSMKDGSSPPGSILSSAKRTRAFLIRTSRRHLRSTTTTDGAW
ncbi:hypothetical protein [Ensifer sp. SL37]|uniref:hypothetical protein n=1 Tax=Ensifer sp. SL37 TaxID=2995137 RepID=UPI003FA37E3E